MSRSTFVRKAIIDAYKRVKDDSRTKPVRTVAVSLGYTIDKNGYNTFVAAVINEYESECSQSNVNEARENA